MIPKKIHYCWFGKNKKSKLFFKCYNSWKKYYPDFEIIEWNEDNFDVNNNNYIKEAYKNKKWAFVSDYARLKILYDEGGIYFDTDVEALKRISDEILEKGYFAKEDEKKINTGLGFGVYPKCDIVKYMLDDYEKIHFIQSDGTFDLTPCPERNTNSLLNRGYVINSQENIVRDIKIYEPDFFCGWNLDTHKKNVTINTYTIHHYEGSWVSSKERIMGKIRRIISNFLGEKIYKKMRKLLKGNNKC